MTYRCVCERNAPITEMHAARSQSEPRCVMDPEYTAVLCEVADNAPAPSVPPTIRLRFNVSERPLCSPITPDKTKHEERLLPCEYPTRDIQSTTVPCQRRRMSSATRPSPYKGVEVSLCVASRLSLEMRERQSPGEGEVNILLTTYNTDYHILTSARTC